MTASQAMHSHPSICDTESIASTTWALALIAFLKNKKFDFSAKTLLAISGGSDSMALLHFWVTFIRPEYSTDISVAHINHGLREQSIYEEAWLRRYCKRHHVSFYSIQLDPKRQAKKHSMEIWAREERYRFLIDVKDQIGAEQILTAHHKDDQIETVLQRISRSSVFPGLSGIPFRREPGIIRPFLDCSKKELIAYLQEQQVFWFEDVSNSQFFADRNIFRHQVIPQLLAREAEQDKVAAIANTVSQLWPYILKIETAEAPLFVTDITVPATSSTQSTPLSTQLYGLNAVALREIVTLGLIEIFEIWLQALAKKNGLCDIPKIKQSQFRELQRQWKLGIEKFAWSFKFNPDKNPESDEYAISNWSITVQGEIIYLDSNSHLAAMVKKSFHQSGNGPRNSWTPNQSPLYFDSQCFELQPQEQTQGGFFHWTWDLMEYRLQYDYRKPEDLANFPFEKENKAVFDAAMLSSKLIVRTRLNGDVFVPFGLDQAGRKLKYFLNDKKIPTAQRSLIPLILSKNQVAWVPGYGISQLFRVTSATKAILQLELQCRTR